MDSPGLYDSEVQDADTVMELFKGFVLADPGPHVFLWVLHGNERFTSRDEDVLEILLKTIDDTLIDHLILVFTHSDDQKALSAN